MLRVVVLDRVFLTREQSVVPSPSSIKIRGPVCSRFCRVFVNRTGCVKCLTRSFFISFLSLTKEAVTLLKTGIFGVLKIKFFMCSSKYFAESFIMLQWKAEETFKTTHLFATPSKFFVTSNTAFS